MDFHKELQKIIKESKSSESISTGSSEVSILYEEFNMNLKRSDKRQMEISLMLEEISENVQQINDLNCEQENQIKNEEQIINSLLNILDIVEDFYLLSVKDSNSSGCSEAETLWNSILKKISVIGLNRIYDEKTPSDIRLNTIVGTDYDDYISKGHIIKTLRSGYLYKDKVIRKSEVIVCKPRKDNE